MNKTMCIARLEMLLFKSSARTKPCALRGLRCSFSRSYSGGTGRPVLRTRSSSVSERSLPGMKKKASTMTSAAMTICQTHRDISRGAL